MASRPMFLQGRGRGRGQSGPGSGSQIRNNGFNPRGRPQQQSRNRPGATPGLHEEQNYTKVQLNKTGAIKSNGVPPVEDNGSKGSNENEKFEEAKKLHQAKAMKHLAEELNADYSSSDEEDLNDEDILQALLKSFGSDNFNDFGRTNEFLMTAMKSKANICLVCIETIKREEAIWNCAGCYCIFHISCIQKWVRDGTYQLASFNEDNKQDGPIPWNCPKCRHEYSQGDCPRRYVCFCGKEEDPSFDPWLVPHSCGQVCSKNIKPSCGHTCLLLCHPGPCPPCPQTVRISCHCCSQPPQVRRCGSKEWSCGMACGKQLSCGQHKCQKLCHSGSCPPCPESSIQECRCGRESRLGPCAAAEWQCEQVCGTPLDCGNHTCEEKCHPGQCPGCPRSGNRCCPCGKTKFDLPCTEDAPTCLETCGKILSCAIHPCTQRCHTGSCGTCREMITKKCRCGKKAREIQCFKEYLCETKCSNMKDCKRHQCKRKCCDGNCPPCDQQCNKPLSCRSHKCSSQCHIGPCYPCPLSVSLSCSCGATSVTVPCGREKLTKPPRCKQLCKLPPDCHHPSRVAHRCHQGRCSPCQMTCNKILQACSHKCPAVCHAAVLSKKQEKVVRVGPWEQKPEVRFELVRQPCPPCQVPLPVTCLGRHEKINMPCSEVRISSCHLPCGRLLICGNHTCQLECHIVRGAQSDQGAGENCQTCEEPCSRDRAEGCNHKCLLGCHPDVCPPCTQRVRMRCHCQLVIRHIECDQWTHAEDTERERLQSCQSKCPKSMPCGHQCKTQCHPGSCPNPERCTEKMKVRCPCRRLKRDFLCNEVQAGYGKVDCDEICLQAKEKEKKVREKEETAKSEIEARRQKEELEEFERKMRGRKRKPRKPKTVEEEPRFLQKYGKFVIAPILVILLSLFVYFLLNK